MLPLLNTTIEKARFEDIDRTGTTTTEDMMVKWKEIVVTPNILNSKRSWALSREEAEQDQC